MNDVVKHNAPAHDLAAFMQGVLRDPNVPADKLDALWRMRRELLDEEHKEAFHQAYAALSAELPQVRKDGTIELIRDGKRLGLVRFTSLEHMDKVLRPLLAKYGFALSFTTVPSGDKIVVRGELTRDGHSRVAEVALPPDTGPGRNSLQATGSSLSYARRYVTEMLLNIVRCGEDDDGNSAAGAGPLSEAQAGQLAALTKQLNETEKRFLEFSRTGALTFAEIPAREFPRLLNALNDKLRRAHADKNPAAPPGRGADPAAAAKTRRK